MHGTKSKRNEGRGIDDSTVMDGDPALLSVIDKTNKQKISKEI